MRRKKTSLWFVGSLLATSIFILTVGLAATTRTENVTVGGYYPGIIVSDVVGVAEGGALPPHTAPSWRSGRFRARKPLLVVWPAQ